MEALKKAILESADPSSAAAKNPPGVEAIYKAIVDEVKWKHNWTNAAQLFDGFLCPLILASTQSASADQQQQEEPEQQPKMKLNRELTAQEIQWVQWAISALVRYAPNPQEANRVYMFFLQQCRPPLRDDATINHCLVSLIYQYAQVKGNDALMSQGLDLIQVALDRGIGMPDYAASQSNSQRQRKMQQEKQNQKSGRHQGSKPNNILASVSRPILRYHKLRISEDGQSLVEHVPSHRDHRQQPHSQQIRRGSPAPTMIPAADPAAKQKNKPAKGMAHASSSTSNVVESTAPLGAPSAADTAAITVPQSSSNEHVSSSTTTTAASGKKKMAAQSAPQQKQGQPTTPPPIISRHPHHFVYSDEPSVKGKKKAPTYTTLAQQAAAEENERTLEELASSSSPRTSGMSGRPKKLSASLAAATGQSRKLPQIRFVAASSSSPSTTHDNKLASSSGGEEKATVDEEKAMAEGDDANTATSTTDETMRTKKPSRFAAEGESHTESSALEEEGLSKKMESMGLSDQPTAQEAPSQSS